MASATLDFGHGGKDPGGTGNGLKEKDIVLKVGLKVGTILERHNVKVVYTRISDVFVELSERASIANRSNTDIFVSIHTNAFSNANAKGLETYSYVGSKKGKALANDVHSQLVNDKLYSSNRGRKTASFAVIKKTKMPACLVELGFITNKDDAKILTEKQSDLALSAAKGILKNLGIKYVEEKKEVQKASTDNLYRVRKSWKDTKTQLGAFSGLQNAIDLATKNKGYKVFDSIGKQVFAETVKVPTKANNEFLVRVTASALNVRSGPSAKNKINGTIRDKGTYTVVDTNGSWGRLKSGAGWISLKYTERV